MSDLPADLPDEVRDVITADVDADATMLAAIGAEIAAKRDEAKAHRSASGIESTWRECEEAYLGMDDANRHEFTESRWAKPVSMDGPVTTSRRGRAGGEHKSTAFLRLTSRYVDAGVAKLGEILLPADDKAFSFSEMPVPELLAAKEDDSQVVHSDLGVPLTRPADDPPPGAAQAAPASPVAPTAPPPQVPASGGAPATAPAPPPGGAPGQAAPGQPVTEPQRAPLTVKDLAIEAIELARKKAKAAETRIYDWMVETQYRAEIRKVLADSARIGVGVFKSPTPVSKRLLAITKKDGGGIKLQIKERIVPAGKWVDPWNFFPDPACGEVVHDGNFVFERDFMSERQVRGLKKLPGYLASQIDRVLEEGPNKVNSTGDGRGDQAKQGKGRFEVWYFYGTLSREEMEVIGRASGGIAADDDGATEANVIATLINDSVVRASLNPLDSGSFPYHAMPWSRRGNHWAGVGVAEQMRAPQRITNAALRALLNNAGKSAGTQIVLNQAAIRPADGNWTITPDKLWFVTNEGPADVRQSFWAFEIKNVTQELMLIITMGERFAEETTSIPLVTQGQSGATTPDTFGAAQLQNNNANQLLRGIGYAFDDYVTEPVVRQYYEWLLLDPDVPDEEKGEFQIDAHGSAALVERAIQDQSIAQMGAMAANPVYGIDPKKWAKLFLKSKKLDPDQICYTPEEQAKIDAAPKVEPPAVTAARIASDTQIKLGVMKQQAEQQTQQAEGQVAAAAHVLEGGKAQIDQTKVHGDLTIQARKLEMEHERALNAEKASLAKTAMQLQVEQKLNAQNNAANERRTARRARPPQPRPPVQAPGRAANGHAGDQSEG